MKFLILRVLTHSELGMFHEYRRQGKEGSKQRAINFDGEVVDRVFPTARDTDRIMMDTRFDTDQGVQLKRHFLTRQAKNWRLEGNCPTDSCYSFVDPGCLFAMDVDSGVTPANGAWVVFPAGEQTTRLILADGSTGGLARAGMIALHGEEGTRVRQILHRARLDMFAAEENGADIMASVTKAAQVVGGRRRLPPRPARTAEIIGGTGHSFSTAIADLVDNAISADATEIDITFAPPDSGHGRWLAITDNGRGMTEAELDEAMTLGSEAEYDDNALGKYGFGMKGASWSQARAFTVVTRKAGGETYQLTWDKHDLGDWEVLETPLDPWETEATTLGEKGTSVLWKDMKPPAIAPAGRGVTPYTAEQRDLERHLALVFHRFLEGEAKNRKKVTIRINGNLVESNNPVGHTLTTPYVNKPIRVPLEGGGDAIVQVQPFLLPADHELRQHYAGEGPEALSNALQRLGMYGQRNQTQGLFIYRNDRLIKWGGWETIWATSDEKTKLARVVVSFDSKLDGPFDVNITKMQVRLPGQILEEVRKLAEPVRNHSRQKYKKEGRTDTSLPPPPASPAPFQPRAPFPSAGGPQPVSPSAPPQPPPLPQVILRPVTTEKFLWKFTRNLGTGGRELQVSDRDQHLAAVMRKVKDDPQASAHLAAFLETLDRLDVQTTLLEESASDP
jgi:hypothetical protein